MALDLNETERESDAAILISEATAAAGMGLVELRRIEASREVAGRLAKSPNIIFQAILWICDKVGLCNIKANFREGNVQG
ncbi:hypothetical protein RYX36_013877 [Vicia faba]